MLIISFAHTTKALLAGKKTVTRRFWDDRHAAKFRKGMAVQAWDRSPRAGGKCVAVIELTENPYRERLRNMPDGDLEAEGGLWESKEEFVGLMGGPDAEPWVVRFRVTRRLDQGQEKGGQLSLLSNATARKGNKRRKGAKP